MGLLDQLAGEVLGGGSDGDGGSPVLKIVMVLMSNTSGGLPEALAKLQKGGLLRR